MNRYEHTDWLLGNSEIGLNESTKQYTAERRLDFVLEHLQAIIDETPLTESSTIEFADKLYDVESLINVINGGVEEELEEEVSIVAPIASIIGGMVGAIGVKSLISHWVEEGTVIPTKLYNLFYDIKEYIGGDSEKEKEMIATIINKMPNVTEKQARKMVKVALNKAPKKKEAPKSKPSFKEWERLNKKHQIRRDFL